MNRYYVYRQRCNATGRHAGELYIFDDKLGSDAAGPFPSYQSEVVQRKCDEMNDADIPNIFDFMEEPPHAAR